MSRVTKKTDENHEEGIVLVYRWVWEELTNGYTELVTMDHADKWIEHLAMQDKSAQYMADS